MADHPSTTLVVQKAQLAMCEAELEVHEEALYNGTDATVKQSRYTRLRAKYLQEHILPKLREEIRSAEQYLEWEARTNNPAPRST